MLTMPKTSEYHTLGWAIDHVMSAPNVKAKTQEEIAEFATRGGYKADRRLVGTYMRNWPEDDKKPERRGKPRSRPPFGFVWALIQGAELTKEQALELTDAWLEIRDEDEQESLRRLCAILHAEDASSETWRDVLDLEAGEETGEEGENVRDARGGQRD
jgi:hypothetical protein